MGVLGQGLGILLGLCMRDVVPEQRALVEGEWGTSNALPCAKFRPCNPLPSLKPLVPGVCPPRLRTLAAVCAKGTCRAAGDGDTRSTRGSGLVLRVQVVLTVVSAKDPRPGNLYGRNLLHVLEPSERMGPEPVFRGGGGRGGGTPIFFF